MLWSLEFDETKKHLRVLLRNLLTFLFFFVSFYLEFLINVFRKYNNLGAVKFRVLMKLIKWSESFAKRNITCPSLERRKSTPWDDKRATRSLESVHLVWWSSDAIVAPISREKWSQALAFYDDQWNKDKA